MRVQEPPGRIWNALQTMSQCHTAPSMVVRCLVLPHPLPTSRLGWGTAGPWARVAACAPAAGQAGWP